jgi:hypothetical protein
LEPELLDDQLGVSEISLQLKTMVGAAHDPIEHLALG